MNAKEKRFKDKICKHIFFQKRIDELKISNKYTGYYLIIEIIAEIINKSRVTSFSREIYPVVAKHFNINDCTIERNIRNLMQKGCCEIETEKIGLNNRDVIRNLTCRKFIYLIKDYIAQQIF